MELTIKTYSSEQDKYVNALLKSLKQLGISVEKNTKKKTKNGANATKIFKELSLKGSFDSVKNPLEWQQEVRKDRKLPR
jgi:hypothetical protein